MPHRLFIAKRPEFAQLKTFTSRLSHQLNLPGLSAIRRVVIYDVHHCPDALLNTAVSKVFADPVTDEVIEQLPRGDFSFVVEPLPGQFDQRADSAEQCLRLIDQGFDQTIVSSATAYIFDGVFTDEEKQRLKAYFINPIESREKDLGSIALPEAGSAAAVPRYDDFIELDDAALRIWHREHNLAMTEADLALVQEYFRQEQRAPTETEIRVLDTYWSDHCRHTTFTTSIEHITVADDAFGQYLQQEWRDYQRMRQAVYGDKAASRSDTLMALATIDAKYLRQLGKIDDVEFSAEVNACSVFVNVDEDGENRRWLLQFKNETHNHPTEIEPFGGAATCIGGAIRDPLSGRAFVYQAMRLSGSGDPREAVSDTLEGKLPQITIAEGSAAGASAYGNQIGLATGQVVEVYHPGYKAKHMEVGAVVAAVPAEHVRREEPTAGDVVILLGGATGRDGCGGATGSSRAQHGQSLTQSAAEVQKGNPPEERKLQRLFRQAEFAKCIKRCNDFGAGGVAVAIGELANGLHINLDSVPVKYQGLSGTELAISESQERMAIVIDAADVAKVTELAAAENLSATPVATVTDDHRLTMTWRGETIVSLDRHFLDTAGAPSTQHSAQLYSPDFSTSPLNPLQSSQPWTERLKTQLASLKYADQRGLGDRFDHSVGAAGVLLPYGGRTQRTPTEASVYTLPTEGLTHTASILAYGFDPDLSAWSPYHGGVYAVVEATARLVACGGDAQHAHYSLQEYFRRLGKEPEYWGLPYSALLGAHHALSRLERAAIGGKDSMSGSFNQLHVPPTLIAFAVSTVDTRRVVSPEFKAAGHKLYWLRCPQTAQQLPDIDAFAANNAFIHREIAAGNIESVRSIRHGGIIQALYESSLGNSIGVDIAQLDDLFTAEYGGYLISANSALPETLHLHRIGETTAQGLLRINGSEAKIDDMHAVARSVLQEVYPLYEDTAAASTAPPTLASRPQAISFNPGRVPQPRVCLPVFPGTNSELDTARAFRRAGGMINEVVIRNREHSDITASITDLVHQLNNSQILALSGGFSAGDEPDGSGKFIVAVLSNPRVAEAIDAFLRRDGLILGICNGFQALIKSGLLPHGRIATPHPGDPTLTHNRIGRHIARVATTAVANNHSPWLRDFAVGELHDVAFSHGEGRFVASSKIINQLINNGQIATQYVDLNGNPSILPAHNPNGSMLAIEGITSTCGKIFGKMGHSERHQKSGQQNYPCFREQDIFFSGVRAFM